MDREKVMAMIRADEQTSLQMLPEPEPGTIHAQIILPITRTLYACIEPPPTRHHLFFVRTRWRQEGGWIAESHGVFVKRREWNDFRQVIDDRPGAFGG